MKKVWSVLRTILTCLLVIAAVGMMIFTIVSVNTFDRNDRTLFGYKAFIVRSDSMSATDFSAGDLIFVKETDPAALAVGDIISYTSTGVESYGETITHKIREITTDAEGNPGFITYGTTTGDNDENIVTYEQVLGKYTGKLPKAGKFFTFLKTTPGYILCIFLPFLLLILLQGFHSISLFRQYRKEQLEELEAERKRLEEERVRSQEMMAELLELKQQMTGGKDTDSAHTKDAETESTKTKAAEAGVAETEGTKAGATEARVAEAEETKDEDAEETKAEDAEAKEAKAEETKAKNEEGKEVEAPVEERR